MIFDKVARERNYDGKNFSQKVKEMEEKKAEEARQAEQRRIEMEEQKAEKARQAEERKKRATTSDGKGSQRNYEFISSIAQR